ncbi:MAG: DoxX family protein [Gemmatimonadaceae bacterium]|nr:DoxX family protein [Gloeobacterales cyanobacterium ES-bin-141]
MYKTVFRVLLSVFMVTAGILHFVNPEPFVRIVPPYLPYHLELVYISGFFEILGGVGLLIPPVSRAAAWGLIALFVAVFPANINMALNNIALEGLQYDPVWHWVRLPLQAVLIAWAWWFTHQADRAASI